jgi:hypothetical protein
MYSSYLIYDHNHQNMEHIKDFGLAKRTLSEEVSFILFVGDLNQKL